MAKVLEEPTFFASAFEALFARTLRGRRTPELVQRLRDAGVDLDRPLRVAYPFKVWEDVLQVLARELHPDVAEEEASFRLGLDFIEGYEATHISKAAIAMARLVGLDRTLQRVNSQLRNINNAAEGLTELRERGRILLRMRLIEKFRGRIHPAPPPVPHYLRGLLQAMLRGLGKENVRVELVETFPADRNSLYELTWTER
jgi:uncharacterized protein (TIGR02265 family)